MRPCLTTTFHISSHLKEVLKVINRHEHALTVVALTVVALTVVALTVVALTVVALTVVALTVVALTVVVLRLRIQFFIWCFQFLQYNLPRSRVLSSVLPRVKSRVLLTDSHVFI